MCPADALNMCLTPLVTASPLSPKNGTEKHAIKQLKQDNALDGGPPAVLKLQKAL